MGLAAAAASQCSLHLYTIAEHIIRGRDQVQNYNIQQASKSQKDILTCRYVLSLLFCTFISKFYLFLIYFVLDRVGVVSTPPSHFISLAKLCISSESDSDSDILSYHSCLVFNVIYKHSWTGHILSLLMLILLSLVSGGAFYAMMPFMNADPI
jgi:hypothetical protein